MADVLTAREPATSHEKAVMKLAISFIAALTLTPTLAGAAAAPGGASAQSPRASNDFAQIMRQSHGLTSTESPSELWGGGPDYKVQFTQWGFEITAALSGHVHSAPALTFELDSISRGGRRILSFMNARTPVPEGNRVRYELAPGIREFYDVRRDGIEQSYVFDQPLPGTGELVVRGRIRTGFPLPAAGDGLDGLTFALPGIGGLDYGAVTGIDAAGEQAAGSLRFDGWYLDLVLPAHFVDTATYPLTLDPLVGPTTTVSSGSDDSDPDIAYDVSTAQYLVVWTREFSDSDSDIRGQRLNSAGVTASSMISIETNPSTVAGHPSVGNCNPSNRFLVAWDELAGSVKCRSVNAVTGGLSKTVTIAGTPAFGGYPDVGGESGHADNELLVVYEEFGNGIRAKQVTVSASSPPDPLVVSTTFLSYHPTDGKPVISKSGGSTGNYLVAWRRWWSLPAPGDFDIVHAVIDRNGNFVVATAFINTPGQSEGPPTLDGNGQHWLLAYDPESNLEIACRVMQLGGSQLAKGSESVLDLGGFALRAFPQIAYAGNEYVLTWLDTIEAGPFLTHTDINVVGLDSVSGNVTEGVETIAVTKGTAFFKPCIASRFSGGSVGNDAMIAWPSLNGSGQGQDIKVHRYSADP